jgi:hypothetical protein
MSRLAIVALLIFTVCGCSSRKQWTPEDAKSGLTEAISLAATAELSIGRAQAGATSETFNSGNVEYLGRQIDDQLKELQNEQPQDDVRAAYEQCRNGLTALRDELETATTHPDAAKARIHSIRQSLERAKASL